MKKKLSVIGNISARKAVGPNSLPNLILKELKGKLKNPITIIINISFLTGKFSKQCKTTNITTVFKKGNKLDSSNYRPISLLSLLPNNLDLEMHIQPVMH